MGGRMPYFLLKTNMAAHTWAAFLAQPEDRLVKSREGARDFGGRHLGYWYSTGAHDGYGLLEAPDSETAGTLQSTLFASGGFRSFQPVPLLTVDQMRDAVARAETWPSFRGYRTPGATGDQP